MLVVVSPTKKQRHEVESQDSTRPLFFKESLQQFELLEALNHESLRNMFKISENLAKTTHALIHDTQKSRAAFVYQGEAFKALDVLTLDQETLVYAQDHFRIFSAVYGLLRPLDAIRTYRLDFLSPLGTQALNLYSPLVTDSLNMLKMPIVVLASQEYAQLIKKSGLRVPLYTVNFLTADGTKPPKIISVHAKQGRGLLARYILINRINTFNGLKDFSEGGFVLTESIDGESLTFTKYI